MELINTISANRTINRHGTKIAFGIAIGVLLICLASIAWDVYTQLKLKQANYATQTIAPIAKKRPETYRVSDMVRANLFGDATPKPVQKAVQKTTLDLTLQGILSATDSELARAIIMSGRAKSKLYSVGESIQGAGVSIEEIRANEVLINRAGAIESLPLKTTLPSNSNSIISYSNGSSGELSGSGIQPAVVSSNQSVIGRSSPKPRSQNGKHRKIRKPDFSGLDRALQKMGEI